MCRLAHYLGQLAPGGVRGGPEVRPATRPARLCGHRPARVAAYVTRVCQLLYRAVEGAAGCHVLERLLPGWRVHARGEGHHLGDLAPGDVRVGAEIRLAAGVARLALPPTRVAPDNRAACQAAHEAVEGRAFPGGRHIRELDGAARGRRRSGRRGRAGAVGPVARACRAAQGHVYGASAGGCRGDRL